MCYTEIPCGHSGISRGAEPGCWHLSEGFTTLFSARSPPKNKICACDGIGRHARFRFSCSNACGFESLQAHHVVADFISFATTFYFKKSSLIHSVAPPFQIEPASLGFKLVCALRAQVGLRRESGRTPAGPPRRPEQEKFSCTAKKPVISRITGFVLVQRSLFVHPAAPSASIPKSAKAAG